MNIGYSYCLTMVLISNKYHIYHHFCFLLFPNLYGALFSSFLSLNLVNFLLFYLCYLDFYLKLFCSKL